MPRDRKAWASWNFIGQSGAGSETADVCVSYWANHLQSLPADAPDLFVTLNPPQPPKEGTVARALTLAHPVFSFDSWQAQQRIEGVQV